MERISSEWLGNLEGVSRDFPVNPYPGVREATASSDGGEAALAEAGRRP
jgi:hypothetical protein